MWRRIPVLLSLTLLTIPVRAAERTPGADPEVQRELQEVRQRLDKYQDPIVAVRDGYLSTVGCIVYPDGAMGVHFLNFGNVSPKVDPEKPQVLIYFPDEEGRLQLAAAEWFVPLATGVKERPQLFGRPFDGPMEGHEPLMPAELHHYDLHVWLWKDNPAGVFHPVNPAASCPERAMYTLREDHVKVLPESGQAGHSQHGPATGGAGAPSGGGGH